MRRPDAIVMKVIRTVVGSLLLVLGVVGIFMPVIPGWLFIIPGLALLARDFAWAERLQTAARQRLDRARNAFDDRHSEPEAERDAA
jgi:uncharacterized protein (TIGR02611 family)